jgi:hypothetical protein
VPLGTPSFFTRASGRRSRKICRAKAWIEIHQEDLIADWNLAVNGKKLFPIKGLDQ